MKFARWLFFCILSHNLALAGSETNSNVVFRQQCRASAEALIARVADRLNGFASSDAYTDISRRVVGDDYFKPGSDPKNDLQRFVSDFEVVVSSFAAHRGLELTQKARLQKWIENVRKALPSKDPSVVQGIVDQIKKAYHDQTVEMAVLNLNTAINEIESTPAKRIEAFAAHAAEHAPKRIGHYLRKGAKWTGITGVTFVAGTAIAQALAPISGPPINGLGSIVQWAWNPVGKHEKNATIKVVDWFTKPKVSEEDKRKAAWNAAEKLNDLKDKTKAFHAGLISAEELDRLYKDAQPVFLKYGNMWDATSPEFKGARDLWANAVIYAPRDMVGALVSADSNVKDYEIKLQIYDLKESLGKKLTSEEEARKKTDLKQLKAARERMGTLLAMDTFRNIMFPDLTEPAFMKDISDKDTSLYQAYQIFRQGLRYDAYTDEYLAEMGKVLRALGIRMNPPPQNNPAVVAKATPPTQTKKSSP